MVLILSPQYSLVDIIFNYTFHFGPPGKYLYLSPKHRLSVGRRSRPQIVVFLDFSIDIFLEVQKEKYSWILYLIDYIAYGPQFPRKFWNSPKSAKTLKCVIVTPDSSETRMPY